MTTVRERIERFHADYEAETARLVAAGVTTEMHRSMGKPRICTLCAKVWRGGGHCTGTSEHPHREVTLYASNH